MVREQMEEIMYLTKENAHLYVGKKLDSSRRTFHYYPLKVIKWPSGKYGVVDRAGTAFPVPSIDERCNIIYFDKIIDE